MTVTQPLEHLNPRNDKNVAPERGDRAILLRYHEIALKGDNRGWFEQRLAINARKLLQHQLGKEVPLEIERKHGRVIIYTRWSEATRQALGRVFGISSYSPMRTVETNLATLSTAAVEEFRAYVEKHGMPRTFRVFTKRSDKALPEQSMDIDRVIGSAVKDAFPSLEVQLKDPEFVLGVEIRHERSFIWTEKFRGHGGLPVGTNARVLSLISGGLDSPVAAIKALRRGSPVSYIHFYGAPFVGEDVLVKVEDLVRLVNRYQPDPQPLHAVHFGKIQEKIALATNPKVRTILYRRMMMRIACKFARKIGAEALITGESMGQVASQTVENLAVIDSVATLPVLRPLVTFDKDEIIEQAKAWGTYETSIRPSADCCTLFADRHPVLRAEAALIEEQEARFSVSDLIREALESVELRRVY